MHKHIKTATGADSSDASDIQAGDWNDPHRLNIATGTDANTTMEVGTCYAVDMSAWATADRTYTLPATASAGDQVAITIVAGNDSFELLITAASGDTLNGVAGGTEWSRLFITGETVTFTCTADNAAWVVTSDGRIPCQMVLKLTTNATGETAATFAAPTDKGGAWTALTNVGGCGTVADGKFNIRRAATYQISGRAVHINGTSLGKYFGARVYDGTTTFAIQQIAGAATVFQFSYGGTVALSSGFLQFTFRSEEGNKGLLADSTFCVMEVL